MATAPNYAPIPPKSVGVLVVDDDRETADLLAELLSGEGYAVERAYDGHRGLELALTGRFEVAVVDRGLPVCSGTELLTRLRVAGVLTRALMLTARGAIAERVEGLDAGADDYLVKPFDVEELLARVRALHRRRPAKPDFVLLGESRLNLKRRQLVRPGEDPIPLSGRECALLAALAGEPRAVLSRERLHDEVFPDTEARSIVDTYVYYLRRKLGRTSVQTVHGIGYRLGTV
ncbi:two-component system, OmpR family, response regulator QseB [Amycolatopsis xylanica]|uniref:Two-component system, OmpR family, response regulator QseB n=1 Tax=Amycolatopsis xylanica TaxID=589385 RepID=A0A1H2V2G5_9PSEU|nr:response regulator transcription factor [Amycolatopsis xylanica]SDW62139.1 two-component system, OmpR family, response regulator QseB [Amycolatopsis xylanica]